MVVSTIKIGKFLSEVIKVDKGLRISPTIFKIFKHTVLLNWNRKCSGMGVPIGDGSQDRIYTLLFADDKLLITQEYEDRDFMVRIRKVGFDSKFRKKLSTWVVEQEPKI